jgi:beta-alanine--pyruvate transaminase
MSNLPQFNLSREALEPYWLPFTPNRAFKVNPRLMVGAKGMYYTTSDGRRILDGMAGLWCVNAGHGQ